LLTGALLAGGKSIRYGRNKALEVFRGKRLIDAGVESLDAFCSPVLVVANDLGLYMDVNAVLVQDMFMHQGPLGGIYTALLFSPHDWVLVKATDMPFLSSDLVSMMLDLRKDADIVVPMSNGLYEPLLALYHRRCCTEIAGVLERGDRKVVSFYDRVRVKRLTEKKWRSVDPQGMSFKNVNTPDDWKHLEWS
jgi:molybdenum cofactor guanylyltransferase